MFKTVVPTVRRFPIWIYVVGGLLVLANVAGSVGFLTGPSALIPGLEFKGPGEQASMMIAARQLGQGLFLLFALLYRNTRTLQMVWAMVIIREGIDLASILISGQGLSPIMVGVTIAIELAAFVHLGAIASGHLKKYRPQESK